MAVLMTQSTLTCRFVVAGALAVFLAAPPFARTTQGQDAPATIRQLTEDVNSTETKVRRKALKSLATMGPEALTPLSLLVADSDRGIRSDAITAVAAIYVQPPPKNRVDSAEEAFGWAPYRVSPWDVPPALVPNLVHDLSDDWPSVRRDAVYGLGVVLTPPIVPALADELIFSLADADSSVRLAAAKVLGVLRVTQAGDSLIGRIVDPVLGVRLASMRALGEIREARALVALRDQLEFYRGGSAARAALDALARIAHPSTAGLFAAERLSENDVHRRYAYEAIARLGGVPANDAVAFERLLTEERNPEVIGAIAFALAAGGRPYVDRIVQALADRDTADQALDYLVELGHAHSELLLPHLQHADPAVRERVAMAVGFTGGAGAEDALTPLTRDPDPAVRQAAQAALMRLRVVNRRPARD
jgi:HEAT repeat protein